MSEALELETGQTTVPYVFINKTPIGGLDKTTEMAKNGYLKTKLDEVGVSSSFQ